MGQVITIFDIEADGLIENATKIHCLSYQILWEGLITAKSTITDYEEMRQFLFVQELLAGHNIIRYDIPMLEKFLEIDIITPVADTLGISWYLHPDKPKHGLEAWGEELRIEKVKISDWKNLTIEDYIKRCEVDVEINTALYLSQEAYLRLLYKDPFRMIRYINFKLSCLRDQENEGIALNIRQCLATEEKLEKIISEKIEILKSAMPLSLGCVIRSKPKIRTDKWFAYLESLNLPPETLEVKEEPNPTSTSQLKVWLDSLGWQPTTFKFSKNTKKQVPQISLPFGAGLCQSVKDLYEVEPALEQLDGLFVAQHRLGLIKGFLSNRDKGNRVYATAHGFTNTMRLQHSKPIVNLPSVDKPYGDIVRSCLTVPDNSYIMAGADVSGLEDNTKQHYIYFFDPKYVNEMRVPGFDPHLDIALVGHMLTEADVSFYKRFESIKEPTKEEKGRYKRIKTIRHEAKQVNFSATYGAAPPKIATLLRKSVAEAKKLHTVYWKRNRAVKLTANIVKVRTVKGQKWLYNPISGFWMYLKAEKDKFSTLNQSSGVYVFDSWLRRVREKIAPVKVIMQYHDELLLVCKKSDKDFISKCLYEAMEETNEEIKLNVEIGISVSWGQNYADCH